MRKVSSLPGKWQIAVFFSIALLVLTADRLSKNWIQSNLGLNESLPEMGWLRLTHIRNTGAAFGLFQDQTFLLTVVAFLGIALLLLYVLIISYRFPSLNNALGKVALGLILGGTMGNLIDRLRFGYITDFADVGFWPAFNVADSSIVVGAIIFAYSLLFLARDGKQ